MKQIILFFIFLFSTLILFPQSPSIAFPKTNSINESTSLNIIWDEVTNADYYNLQISDDSLFSNIITDSSNINSVNININFQSTFMPYYLRIRYYKNSSFSQFSGSLKFYVFNPKNIDSLILWLCSDSLVAVDSLGKVSLWTDLSNKSNNAQQVSDIFKPVRAYKSELNHYSVDFLGSTKLLTGNYINSVNNKNRTIIILLKNQYISGDNDVYVNYNTGIMSSMFIENSIYLTKLKLFIGSGVTSENKNLNCDLTGTKVISVKIDNSLASCYVNNIWKSQQQYTLFNNYINKYALGGRYNGTTVSQAFSGSIYTIIDYNKTLSNPEISLVNTYLLHRYTPPVNLGPNILRRYGFCDTSLTTTHQYESYLWSTGDTTRKITIAKEDTGWYWCQVPNLYGQMMRDSVYVYNLLPKLAISDTTVCLGTSASFQSPYPGGTSGLRYNHIWQDISSGDTLSNSPTLTLAPSHPLSIALSVSDTLGCFITDTFSIAIDTFALIPSLGPDRAVCTGDKINLTFGDSLVNNYLWSSGDTLPYITIYNAGSYSLQTENLRGCISNDTLDVSLHGVTPSVGFYTDSVCFGKSTILIDTSYSNDVSNIINWKWELGDGSQPLNQSTSQPINHIYPDTGSFNVKLTITTDSTCTNYTFGEVYVYSLPRPDFFPLTACEGFDLNFTNSTFGQGGLITNYFWDFGDGDTAFQNPSYSIKTHKFLNQGQFSTKLIATDINGCIDSVAKTVSIRPVPKANFVFSKVCDGEPVSFTEEAETEVFNPIQSFEWNFQNANPSTGIGHSPTSIFPTYGEFPVSLKVSSLNGCWDTITKTIKIHPYPVAAFSSGLSCLNDITNFTNFSTIPIDSIDFFHWSIDGSPFSLDVNPKKIFTDTLNHSVSLFVRSVNGCEDEIAKIIKPNSLPKPAFTQDKIYGLPPMTVTFANKSTLASSYVWDFGDGSTPVILTSNQSVIHTYNDSAIFIPKLVAFNQVGCSDSAKSSVNIIYLSVDVEVISTIAIEENGYMMFSCKLRNNGMQPINKLNLSASYYTGQKIMETWTGDFESGEIISFVFSSKLSAPAIEEVGYYCISAEAIDTEPSDERPDNNTFCKELIVENWVGSIYPNPSSEEFNIEVVLEEENSIDITISDINGKKIKSEVYPGLKGLNRLKISTKNLVRGTYNLRLNSNGIDRTTTIIKL